MNTFKVMIYCGDLLVAEGAGPDLAAAEADARARFNPGRFLAACTFECEEVQS